MAPFGRNFLKARLKNRSEKDTAPGREIQVWVCQEEKIVCGVKKRTTCLDIVQALLEDHKNIPEHQRVLHGEPQEYCLLERWKGFERALPSSTRILRLWDAWGDEKLFVQFALVQASDLARQSNKKAARHRAAWPKSKQRNQDPRNYVQSLPIEQQRHMVRKAFRKLEKIRKENNPDGADRIDGMVQLIISQDQTIRQQIHHMRELDLEINCIEQRLCTDQQTSLEQMGRHPPEAAECIDDQLLQFLQASDDVDQLEAQVKGHKELIIKLSQDIELELLRLLTDTEALEAESALTIGSAQGSLEVEELEGMRRELERSMHTGLVMRTAAVELQDELNHSDAALHSRSRECERLAAQLSSLDVGGASTDLVGGASPGDQEEPHNATDMPGHTPTMAEGTDTDSDTGISSTHSQDSLSPYRKKPPSLDTDV